VTTEALDIHYQDDLVTLYAGDCIEVMGKLPDASVEAVVTDPPYGLEFMGREWDAPWKSGAVIHDPATERGGFQDGNGGNAFSRSRIEYGRGSKGESAAFGAWCSLWVAEALRVLKPGGHLLAFGGTRTWHRLACAVEDAGFEVRDSIAWLYGSGFPKSMDLAKQLDKREGIWRGRAGEVESDNGSMGGANYKRTDKGEPVTAAAAAAGWGTALKPAFEPCVVARKPLAGTVADNWLKHGTGALNIDACRVGTDVVGWGGGAAGGQTWNEENMGLGKPGEARPVQGRWPANVLLDKSQASELDKQTGVLTSGANPTRRGADSDRTVLGAFGGQEVADAARGADSGGGSRFFPVFRYEAKAPQDERPKDGEVAHPTVKPLDLMRWLVRLVTPTGGTVLEPFAGSGTTAEACVIEGFRCIAIERESSYLPLIVNRLTKPIQPDLFGGAA
jgi:site-specific DNA-methyltransferase (adenine-specific)